MDSSAPPFTEYLLGPFKIKGSENLVVHNDEEIVVLPKVMSLLLHFCQNSGEVLTFDALNNAIWPNEVVGDNAIYNLVGQLRKILGDKASNPTYIQTISKIGYKLLVEATPVVNTESVENADITESAENAEVLEPVSEPSTNLVKARRKSGISKWLIPFILIVSFTTIFASKQKNEGEEALSTQAQSQMQLAHYQLYRGDGQGVTQAIETLQELIASEPKLYTPKLELAYSFIRMARIEPAQKEFWLQKARAISQTELPDNAKARLTLILNSIGGVPLDIDTYESLFSLPDVLNNERLAYSDILFDAGQTELALTHIQRVLDSCLDCPYVYRKIATTHIVLGQVKEGFDNFAQYSKLLNKPQNNPIDTAGFVPLNLATLSAMAKWHSTAQSKVELLSHQRNTLALFYLTLNNIQDAEALLPEEVHTSESFFDLYTLAAIAGAKGDFHTSYRLLLKRQNLYPDNKRFKLSVVYALWQLGNPKEAIDKLSDWELVPTYDSLPNDLPFSEWALYASLLIETGEEERGREILSALEQQLASGMAIGSHSADIRLASVLALQGITEASLNALEDAISQGWVSDFNQNWWYLQDSPFFISLKGDPRFEAIVDRYNQNIQQLNITTHNEREGE
ncbi:winged helix-turn-helix domain-containing protein [Alteromonas sp. KUL49]|uniref:winged helix-turn-helix domain-containing protein n=1 Tax=Alteromonas sp. KUL49 TaxID=2480798 RepID=UPI00102EF7C0|nr:winged helix-turn-helix domain-containing protein [Alteromonas sp. KUL49]TAP38030.1 hypothetical protein EYS00_16195 [Alteromonas sp. KUL49]GEA12907.1 hypothetical protein KUL49_32820 [Alteromonas sp. KUL49]